ncbi:uncharacterized protein WCC33_000274 [Rhinophrynus dorsalis]
MPRCLVTGCNNYSSKASSSRGLKMHAFPLNLDRIKVWLKRIGQDFGNIDTFAQKIMDSKKSNPYRICSAHFTPDCYITQGTKTVLTTEAVPSIFPNREPPAAEVDAPTPPPSKRLRADILGKNHSPGAEDINKLPFVIGSPVPVPIYVMNDVFSHTDLYREHRTTSTQFNPYYGVKNKRVSTDSRYFMKNVGTSPDPQEHNSDARSTSSVKMVDACTSTDPAMLTEDKACQWQE